MHDVLHLLLEHLQMVRREEEPSSLRWIWEISEKEVPISETWDYYVRGLDVATLALVKPGGRHGFDLR